MTRILALDLGTKTGVASNYHAGFPSDSIPLGGAPSGIEARTICLATDREITAWGKERLTRRNDPRARRLYSILSGLEQPDVVVFEDVEFSSYTYQCQLWASYRTAAWLAFDFHRVIFECVPVATLKRFATGNGGADKADMERALFTRGLPRVNPSELDDNAIDAVWILLWAEKNLGRLSR